MKIDGACHCGAITFEAEVDPASVLVCHCTDCQTLSGGPFRTLVPAPRDAFHLRSGEPRLYLKTAESGARRVQAFCGECGTPLYSAAPENTPAYVIRIGAIRQRAALKPSRQFWCRSAVEWLGDLAGVPRLEKQ